MCEHFNWIESLKGDNPTRTKIGLYGHVSCGLVCNHPEPTFNYLDRCVTEMLAFCVQINGRLITV